MITVLIYKESRFPADRLKIKTFVQKYLASRLKGLIEVSISIVGDRKMRQLNTDYRSLHETTDVLSFPLSDPHDATKRDVAVGFSPVRSAPDEILRLGDVIVSYPQAVLEASEENMMVDQKIEQLIAHGIDHLLGIHHD